jgi:ribosome-associated toxin RatA of RatAB toxin-antitoxin module
MRPVSAKAQVAVSRSEAWEKLQDLMLAKRYVPGVTDIEITTRNKAGLGASRKVFVKGRPPIDETVIAWEDGHGFTVRLHRGDQPASPFRQAQFVYRLDDAPGATTMVTTTLAYELPWGVLGQLLDAALMRHVAAQMVKAIVQGLKHVYESAD